jgi:hypothetical protein
LTANRGGVVHRIESLLCPAKMYGDETTKVETMPSKLRPLVGHILLNQIPLSNYL